MPILTSQILVFGGVSGTINFECFVKWCIINLNLSFNVWWPKKRKCSGVNTMVQVYIVLMCNLIEIHVANLMFEDLMFYPNDIQVKRRWLGWSRMCYLQWNAELSSVIWFIWYKWTISLTYSGKYWKRETYMLFSSKSKML